MKTLDAGQAETNKLIEKVEKRVNKEYSQATKDMQKKLNDYLKSFESKDKAMQKQLADGLITDKQYKDWRFGQIMTGKRWQEQLDVLSKDLENSRQIAMNIVSGELPSAYAIGHNYGTFLVENGSKLNTSYTLYDRDTVAKLMKDRPKLLPDPTKGSKTQQALKSKQIQKWSKAKMTSAVAQGVLQGEAIPKIASRLRNVTDMSYRASIRNARTMLTSCENLGRQASFERAHDMGIEMEKQWLATLDDRTRDSHALMDGERVPLDENFSNGLEYPADPSGEPEEIYNCRCTMVTAIKGFEKALTDFDLSENEKLGDMTYEEWKDSHLHGAGETIEEVAESVYDAFAGKGFGAVFDDMDEVSPILSDKFSTEAWTGGESVGEDAFGYYKGLVDGIYKNEEIEKILDQYLVKLQELEKKTEELEKYKAVAQATGGSYPRTQAYLDNLYDVASAKAENERALQLIEKNRKEIATKFGVSEKEAGELLDNGIAKIIEDSEMTIAIDADKLGKVLDEGYFKNQFETQSSGGALTFDGRRKCEFKEFNVPKGAEILDADRPVYGALQPKFDPGDDSVIFYYQTLGGAGYGDGIKVALDKEKVINNATMTIGDSLNRQYSIFGTEMNAPKFTGTGSPRELESIASVGNAEISGNEGIKKMGMEYYEFQLHGKEAHSIDMIKEVYIDADQCISAREATSKSALIKKLDEKGIPWRLYGSDSEVARAEAALGLA